MARHESSRPTIGKGDKLSRIAVVANPVADVERQTELRSKLRDRKVTWLETTEEDPGVGQAREAIETGADLVIACGGDGTVRACAEGMAGSEIPLGLIPAGTGNLLALNLGVPEGVEDALDLALHGPTSRVDAGEAAGELFVVMAGIGLDATIMEETASDRKEKLGTLAYVIEGIKHLGDDSFSASITGEESDGPIEGEWATVLVGNFGLLHGGVDLFPDSSPMDRRLDLIAIPGESTSEKIASALKAASGLPSENLVRGTSESFEISIATPVRYELDGEARKPVTELQVKTRWGCLFVKGIVERG
jgi:diacylglycerol kinase (ATP)